MPQLETNLWACTGFATWSVILGYIPGKIASHYYANRASSRPFNLCTPLWDFLSPKPPTQTKWS
uniref:ATP synthase complex subunit 8 n=1 Tax=Neobythites unimaculatus TaxID=1188027 RepID=A0A7I6NE66_9TELE|nr:ATPase subunits 8 [Neobythites unimaculatus]